MLSHLTVTRKEKSNLLAVLQSDLDSRNPSWCVGPFKMHRWIIMSHNLVTEIKEILTRSKIGTQFASHRDMMSKIQICLYIIPMMQGPSPCLRPDTISIWWLVGEAVCRSDSLPVQQALHSEWVMNRALQWAGGWIYSCSTVSSQNLADSDCVLVERSLAAFVIFRGECRDTPYPLKMLSVQVQLHHHPIDVYWLLVPSNWMFRTGYLVRRSSWLHHSIRVLWIRKPSSSSVETCPSTAVPFWRLCPSPSWVRHHCSACPSLSLDHPRLPHPTHRRYFHDHSDSLR